jgi:uncharacterized protein (UPF0147 family)
MAWATIKVVATQLDKVKQVFKVVRDLIHDERVPVTVREEVLDKVNSILEAKDDEWC